ncbi:MAG: YIP1 family protein [Methanomicrobiales archaeon]
MPETFIESVKGFLLQPVETFQSHREATLGEALKYYIILIVIFAVLSALLALAGITGMAGMMGMGLGAGAAGVTAFVMVLIGAIVGGIIGILIGGVLLHIFVYIVGGRKGIGQTIKALAYAETPALLLGWIPVINIIGGIWAFVLTILGIRELHEISTSRAIIAVILPLIIVFVLVTLFAAYLLVGAMSTVPVTTMP